MLLLSLPNPNVYIFASTLLLLLLATISDSKSDNVRICVSANPNVKSSHAVKNCEQLARSKKTHASCIFAVDRLDCLRLVSDRKADMTVLEAEDLRFAAATCTGKCAAMVVSEVRLLKKEPYEYKAVVVVRDDALIRNDLRGARLCHPGFTIREGRTALFTQFLEERLAPQSCNSNLSLLEDRLSTSNAYFGPSCKAGTWSADPDEDARLKATYPNLCAACDNPQTCSTNDKYWGDGGAATCLRDGAGDALWTTLADVRIHFKIGDEANRFRFLCMDSTYQSLETEDPCIWMARPWQVVVANSKMAMEVQKTLDMISDDQAGDWEGSLLSVFDAHKEYIVNLEVSKPAEDYLETIPGYQGPSDMSLTNCNPRHQVTWCTSSPVEYRKCALIAEGAVAFAVAPGIQCQQRNTIEMCIEAVGRMEADVIVVPPDYQPSAILNHDLQALFYEDFKAADGKFTLSAVVKSDSPIKTIADLKSRSACFTLHDGLAWRSVLVHLRASGLVSSSCSSTGVLHDFFSKVCVSVKEGDMPVCCGKSVEANADGAALRCLASDGCDVAFINNKTLSRDTGNSTLRESDFRSVCSGDKFTDCSWAWSPPSAIMAARGLHRVRLQEVKHVFAELSRLFMRRNKSKSLVLAIFGPFQDEKNVLFQDSSADLISADRLPENRHNANSLEEIVNLTRYCSSAPVPHSPHLTSLVTLLIPLLKLFS